MLFPTNAPFSCLLWKVARDRIVIQISICLSFRLRSLTQSTQVMTDWRLLHLAPCTYLVVSDRSGVTDIATLSLYLFSATLRALQNFNTVHSETLFSSPNAPFVSPVISLLALFFVKLSWLAPMILIPAQTTLTCVSLLWLTYHHRAQCLSLTASLVMWSLYEMPSNFLTHLISVACNFLRMSAVNVQVSQAYNSTERISLNPK